MQRILKSALFAGVAALAITSTTSAQANDFNMDNMYVAVLGGFDMVPDQDASDTLASSGKIGYENGYSLGAAFGYRYDNNVRAEIEIRRQENDIDKLFATTGVNGKSKFWSYMVNGYYDFDLPQSDIRPYIGLGIGFTTIDANVSTNSGSDAGDETTLAGQFMLGGTMPITENFDLGLEYRYVLADEFEFSDSTSTTTYDYDSHGVNVRLTYNF